MKENVTLSCLSPEGLLEAPPSLQPLNPRLRELDGKKIRLLWDGKMGGENFCAALQEVLRDRYPGGVRRMGRPWRRGRGNEGQG